MAPKNLNEGKSLGENLATCKVFAQAFLKQHPFKVFGQAFFKKLAVSKGSALVARARAKRFFRDFLFAKLFLLVGAGARPVGDEASAINGKNKEH